MTTDTTMWPRAPSRFPRNEGAHAKVGIAGHRYSDSNTDSCRVRHLGGRVADNTGSRAVRGSTWAGMAALLFGSGIHAQDANVQNTGKVEEVVVTAQKREERLQDVPVPMTAISTENLVDSNQLRLTDYYSSVPGLNVTSGGQGDVGMSIRGVTTGSSAGGFANPTVGVTVDDVPYGSSTGLGGGINFPDLDPSDLQRIEVLRGPQGTLYGASSIGGVVKFVTADPSTAGVTGRVQTDINRIENNSTLGYGVRAAVNVPLGETVAIRASGFSRRDPGYITDPTLHRDGVNETDVRGGRVSMLWEASSTFSVKLSAFLQNAQGDGASSLYVDEYLQPRDGDLRQSALLRTGTYEQEAQVYSATFNLELGATQLTAISGYQKNQFDQVLDSTRRYSALADELFGVTGSAVAYDRVTDKFTQEIRWGSIDGERFDWRLGLFYTDEDSPTDYAVYAADPATGARTGVLYTDPFPSKYSEWAVFGDVTLHVTDRFDIQIGGRQSEIKQRYEEIIAGPGWAYYGFPDPSIQPPVHTKDSAFTYLITPQLKLNQDLMVYARIASGYRPGGPNPTCDLFGFPCDFNPDETTNYELGVKGSLLDQRLSFDASVYYIDWKDMQLGVNNCCAGYNTNAGGAKSEGVELAAEAHLFDGLRISGWVAYNNAELTSDFPAAAQAYGQSGDRLPFSSRFSGNLAIDDEFPISATLGGFVGGSVSYVGERKNDFSFSPAIARLLLPSYTKVDLHAGVRYDAWKVSLFASNLTDERGIIGLSGADPLTRANYVQPRTIGLSASREF